MRKIAFLDGNNGDYSLLRAQILDQVIGQFNSQTDWSDINRESLNNENVLSVSLFIDRPADVHISFDLSDRNHLLQRDVNKLHYLTSFRKVMVPGRWTARRLAQDTRLKLPQSSILVVGSPRVDYLRQVAAARMNLLEEVRPARGVKVLLAMLHDNWRSKDGQPMSCADRITPFVDIIGGRCDLVTVIDGRNRPDKRPITDELIDADIVITDYTSLMYEAWALGKPVIFPRWLLGDEVIRKAPNSAEAHIYADQIGHHADGIEQLIQMIETGPALGLGDGVDAFMDEYLANYREGNAAEVMAGELERLADPDRELRELRMRTEADAALKAKQWPQAEELLGKLVESNRSDMALYDKLAQSLSAQGKFWQEVGALETAISLTPNSASLYQRLGLAEQRMGRNRAAATALAAAIGVDEAKATADWYYRLGYALETPGTDGDGDSYAASEAYAKACAMDAKYDASRFGVGVLHVAAGRWKAAQAAFAKHLGTHLLDAELHQKLGMSHDRCYEWAEAESHYRTAIALDPARPGWHYRLGFVLERQGKFDEAAPSYLHAAALTQTPQPMWHYRAGFVLEKAGRLEEACDAFRAMQPDLAPKTIAGADYLAQFDLRRVHYLKDLTERRPRDPLLWKEYGASLQKVNDIAGAMDAAMRAFVQGGDATTFKSHANLSAKMRELALNEARLDHDCVNAGDWLSYSRILESVHDYAGAAAAMRQAILRHNDHKPDWQYRLGCFLAEQQLWEEACAAFRGFSILQQPHGTYEDKFKTDKSVRFYATYREYIDVLPLDEKAILYEVHNGSSMSCSPLAIFEALISKEEFSDYNHFWIVNDPSDVNTRYRNRKNVYFIKRGSETYLKLLATSKYLICNGTFAEYFVRRPGQKYLNTWHGTPLKTLGSAMLLPPVARANTSRNFLHTTHMIFPNEHTRAALIEGHSVDRICAAQRRVTGYPRNDQLARPDTRARAELAEVLGLEPGKPAVLFAPTYRGSWNSPELEAEHLVHQLQKLESEHYTILFRGHHLVEKMLRESELPVKVVPQSIDTNAVLAVVDVLISDYSSIIVDYMVLKRPIIQFVPDWQDYAETRGLYFDRNDMPFAQCDTEQELQEAIQRAITEPDSFITTDFLALRERFCGDEDGLATERTIRFFFEDEAEDVPAKGGKGVIIRTALGTINGVASSAIALTKNLGSRGHDVVLMLDSVEVKKEELGNDKLKELESYANILFRTGRSLLNLEEQWVFDKFNTENIFYSDAMRAVYLKGCASEAYRLVGGQEFRLSVEHQGYHPFWVSIMAAMKADRHVIYLHNDMVEESRKRLPTLRRVFKLYSQYQSFINVSESSLDVNRQNISAMDAEIVNGFSYARNGLDYRAIVEQADVDLLDPDLDQYNQDSRIKIINLARLWPEKNQIRLIESMRVLVDDGHDVALYILGSGPLRPALERRIGELGLRDRISLFSVKRNPFPFLRGAQCHVLSSDYEGQGIVLLEAMTLNVPCVSTDIPGPQSVLADGLGVLVEPSVDALAAGIAQVITGNFVPNPFDAEAYNATALAEFMAAAQYDADHAAEDLSPSLA